MLSKKEVVLHQTKLQPCELDGSFNKEYIDFCSGKSDPEEIPTRVSLSFFDFDDMGAPLEITVCVRPGGHLNG